MLSCWTVGCCCSYFLGHAPPHHWGRGHPASPSVFLGPSPPAEIKNKSATQIYSQRESWRTTWESSISDMYPEQNRNVECHASSQLPQSKHVWDNICLQAWYLQDYIRVERIRDLISIWQHSRSFLSFYNIETMICDFSPLSRSPHCWKRCTKQQF